MININIFSPNHPNGKRNRDCIYSPELLIRIDKDLAMGEIPVSELNDLEQIIRCTNRCYTPQWLLSDLYNFAGMTVRFGTISASSIKAEVTTNELEKPTNDTTTEVVEPEPEPEVTEPVMKDIIMETEEPKNEENTEVNEPTPENQEPAPEPAPTSDEQSEQPTDEAAPKKGGRKRKNIDTNE